MCSIARRARAIQERDITELVDAIRETEQTFIQGGDITHNIHDLKAMAEGIGGFRGDDDGKSKTLDEGGDMPRMKASNSSSSSVKSKRTSMFGSRKGISFQMNSTANVIAAMTQQQDEMDKKMEELEGEKERWKTEFVSLRRKVRLCKECVRVSPKSTAVF